MLTKRIIPCLDIRDGRVVKGVRFANLRDAGDPVEQARRYEAQGADELVMLDVSATSEGRTAALESVRAVRSVLSIPLSVGGGVRRVEDVLALLRAGADKVALNTAAVDKPKILRELSERVGAQCVVISIDAASRANPQAAWEVVTHAGMKRPGLDAVKWAQQCERLGVGEILLTSWDRDGTRHGYDTDLIGAIRKVVQTPIIASGGAATPEHMVEALRAGADAVLAASIFHDADMTVGDVKGTLQGAGVEVRL